MTPRLRLTSLLAAAALAAALAAGCGGDDGGSGSGGGNGAGSAPEQTPQQVVDRGDAAGGKQVFADNCAACHGEDGGGGTGPELAGRQEFASPDVVVEQVRDGGGGMPGFEGRLSDQELADVSAYVVGELAK